MKKLAVLLLSLCVALTARGVDITRYFTERDGLSDNRIIDMFDDARGYLWICSSGGFSRFDGEKITSYSMFGGPVTLQAIFPHKDGKHIWVCTWDKTWLFDMQTCSFTPFSVLTDKGEPLLDVRSGCYDREGRLWFASSGGTFRYDEAKGELRMFDSRRGRLVYVDGEGTVWLGAQQDFLKMDPHGGAFIPVADVNSFDRDFPSNEVTAIAESADGRLWVATWNGEVAWFDKGEDRLKVMFQGARNTPIAGRFHCIFDYSATELLLASDTGLFLMNKYSGKTVVFNAPSSQDSFYKIIRDLDNGLWLGTYYHGIAYISPDQRNIVRHQVSGAPGEVVGSSVRCFCAGPGNDLWVGTNNGGLNRYDAASGQFKSYVSVSYKSVQALLPDGRDLWIGTFSKGLDRLDLVTGRVRKYRTLSDDDSNLSDDHIYCLKKTSTGELWVGTMGGVCRFLPETETFLREKAIGTAFVKAIAEDASGALWFSTRNAGVFRRDADGKWSHWHSNDEEEFRIPGNNCNGILAASDGSVWCATDNTGLLRFGVGSDEVEVFGQEAGLPNHPLLDILEDQQGNLWISSIKGILCWSPKTCLGNLYTVDDGLHSNLFTCGAAYKAPDGQFWFGGVTGCSVFYPERLTKDREAPSVMVSAVKYSTNRGQTVIRLPEAPIILPHKNYNVGIRIDIPYYINPERVHFEWKLAGFQKEWMEAEGREFNFVSLAPGNYRFAVRACIGEDVKGEANEVLSLVVRNNPFLSPLAIGIYALLLLGLVMLVSRMVEARKREAREVADARSKIDFFSNVAHEIKTPVTLIKAPLEQIIATGKWNKDVEDHLSMIRSSTERLQELVGQLLDFRKIDAEGYKLSYETVDLRSLVVEMVRKFSHTDSGATLSYLIPDGPMLCRCDKEAMTKVLSNLLMNALKYGGKEIKVSLELQGQSAVIKVMDDGKGVPDNMLDAVFKPFTQVSPGSNEGFGIGLSLVKMLVDKHQGSVRMRNLKPSGCEVEVRIPYLPDKLAVVEEEETESVSDRPDALLIVDDTPEIRQLIKGIFQNEHRILTAGNGLEALDVLGKESVSVIISDLMMPMMDGIELLKAVRQDEILRNTPFIILSAKGNLDAKIAGLENGADAYIEKPFSVQQLKATIDNITATRRRLLENFRADPEFKIESTNILSQDRLWLNKVDDLIKQHLADSEYSVDDMAKDLATTRKTLQRRLKALVGASPADYVKMYRLRMAARLISNENYRVNEVAWMVGFTDPSYFTKCFFNQFNILPKDYRKAHSDKIL